MPKYFFDIEDGSQYVDEIGVDCADLAAARQEAIRATGDMLRDNQEFWKGEVWMMKVRDEGGAIVSKLTFEAR